MRTAAALLTRMTGVDRAAVRAIRSSRSRCVWGRSTAAAQKQGANRLSFSISRFLPEKDALWSTGAAV